jgi:uncharacterized protein YccT (UPF0319 family)
MRIHPKNESLSINKNTLESSLSTQSDIIFSILKKTKKVVTDYKKYINYMNNSGLIKLPELTLTFDNNKEKSKNITTLCNTETVNTNDKMINS